MKLKNQPYAPKWEQEERKSSLFRDVGTEISDSNRTLLISIQETPGSNLGRETDYTE
jgi:hypothetical protein